MASRIRAGASFTISSGVAASRNSRSDAGRVVSSLVRRLKMQEIKTKNGLLQRFPTKVTDGSGRSFIAFFSSRVTSSIFLLLTFTLFLLPSSLFSLLFLYPALKPRRYPDISHRHCPDMRRALILKETFLRETKRYRPAGLD